MIPMNQSCFYFPLGNHVQFLENCHTSLRYYKCLSSRLFFSCSSLSIFTAEFSWRRSLILVSCADRDLRSWEILVFRLKISEDRLDRGLRIGTSSGTIGTGCGLYV